MTKWIGLTGGIGSGKSSIAKLFLSFGIPFLDADEEVKKLSQNPIIQKRMIEAFPHLPLAQNKIQKKALRHWIFSHPKEREKLESITHPELLSVLKNKMTQNRAPLALLMAPTLLEHQAFLFLVKEVILVGSSREKRIQRVMKRDGVSAFQVECIMDSQITLSEARKKSDYYLENSQEIHSMRWKVRVIFDLLHAAHDAF